MNTPTIAQLSDLITRAQSTGGFDFTGGTSQQQIRKLAAQILKGISQSGAIHSVQWTGKRLEAFFALHLGSTVHAFSSKRDIWAIRMLADPARHGSLAFIKNQIRANRHFIAGKNLDGRLLPGLRSVMPALEEVGIQIECLILCGEVKVGLRNLLNTYPELNDESWPLGLKVRRIQKRDIAPALELVLKLFGDHPQFGSYVCDPLFVKMLKDEWTIDLTRSHPLAFVLERNGRIVGQFDIYPHLATVFGRKTGSLGLNLHKSLQGRGLAKRIYLHLLKQMSRHRIHYFMGGTSQPGVMRLSKVMQRKAVGYELRSKKPAFPARYFLNY